MGEFRTLEHERVGIRRDEQIALAVVGDVRLAHGGADINDRLPDVVLAELGNVECRRPGDQHRGAVAVHLPGQRIPGAVETIRHEIVGYTGSVIAVDDLVDALVLVDGHRLIGRAAGAGGDAVGLVVVGNGNLRVAHGDLDGARLGAALVVVVEDDAVLEHKLLADLRQHERRIAFLKGVSSIGSACRHNLFLLKVSYRDSGEEKRP